MNTKYTFLLPAYKSIFLEEALNSIKAQTFRDFKCIVSDDCSPENIKSIYDNVVGHDVRFCYHRNDKNIGGKNLVSHWNTLVKKCDTEYLIIAGDDDVYFPDFLKNADYLLTKYPSVNLFRSRVCMVNAHDDIIYDELPYDEYIPCYKYNLYRHNPQYINCIGNYIFKSEKIIQNGGFVNFPFAWFSDTATALALSLNGVACSNSVQFKFRSSGLNITCSRSKNNLRSKFKATELFTQWYKQYYNTIPTDNTLLCRKYMELIKEKMYSYWRFYYSQCCSSFSFYEIIKIISKAYKDDIVTGKLDFARLSYIWLLSK